MYKSLTNLLRYVSQYTRFGILGFGREGKAFLHFCLQYREQITHNDPIHILIFDKFLEQDQLNQYLKEQGIDQNAKNIVIQLYSGERYTEYFSDADIIVKAPGVSCFRENISDTDIKKYNITSLSNLFLQFFGNQTIGITGTKGKSTTSALLHYLFTQAERESFLVGNIGTPVFEILENITDKSVIIHEFSSHQLEHVTVGPKIAVLLNMFPEHLDYYKDTEAYFNAKKNIFRVSPGNDNESYISIENDNFHDNDGYNQRKIQLYFNQFDTSETYLEKVQTISVHKDSIRVAKIISDIYNLFPTDDAFIASVNTFPSLAHRLELIKTKNIWYINDSISTIPESTIEGIQSVIALERFGKKLETIILGGFDRGVCLDTLVDFVMNTNIKNIFLTGETGKILKEKIQSKGIKYSLFFTIMEKAFGTFSDTYSN